jgi:hypothetical protein
MYINLYVDDNTCLRGGRLSRSTGMYIYTYIYIHVFIYIYTFTYKSIFIHIHTSTYIYIYIYINIHIYVHQVGINKRLMVFNEKADDTLSEYEMILCNPVIIAHSEETDLKEEGCLSFPQIYGIFYVSD